MKGSSGTARIDDRGRLVLPAEFRRRLGLSTGDEVRLSIDGDGAVRLENRRAAAHALIGLAGSSSQSAVELLRDDRRVQAGAEEADARRFAEKASANAAPTPSGA
jgi:AbrB family looped-hinge helix DNA binding protein